jgi:hypothetical protein
VATTVAGFSPERVKLLLDTCLATSHDNRDFGRPWLNRTFGAMFNRLRGDEQVALERAFTERYGYGIDAGPQGYRTPTTPTADTPDPVPSRIKPVPLTQASNGSGFDGPVYEPTEEAEVIDD